jgi:hypothetical protein
MVGLPCQTSPPLLSLLVPTYNHAQGLRRIVESLGELAHDTAVEVRVHDDSSDDGAAREIEQIVRTCARGIYQRNVPSQGAVPNWNGLLDAAQGEFCLLMHHDEYFETVQSLRVAIDRMRDRPAIDGVVFPCRVVSAGYPRGRLHMPAWMARWIVEACPGYMLSRNPLGAPSALLLRRTLYPRYDDRLRWLVDCELYVRAIVANRPVLVFQTGPGVLSDASRGESITASLGSLVGQIRADELRLLAQQGLPKARGAWLVSQSTGAALARAGESVVWTGFRSIQRLAQFLLRGR